MSQENRDPRRSDEAKKETEPTPTQSEARRHQEQSLSQQKTEPLKRTEQTRPTPPYHASEAGGPMPDLDEGPQPGPVDEVQEALFEAARQGTSTELDIDDLPEPLPELDAGPQPGPVDEVQEAIFEAAQRGTSTELDFDQLPSPGLPPAPKKVVKFTQRPSSKETKPILTGSPTQPVEADTPLETTVEDFPLPDFPEPDPSPTISDFWLLLALFTTFRLATLFLLRPGGFIRDWSDFNTYLGIAGLSDYSLFPFVNFWLEWPPLVPWLAVGAYRLSLLLPPWGDDPRLWFILILGIVFVLFEVGNFVLIYRLARRLFDLPLTINRVLWLYAGLFPPVYAMLGFFDGIALFFILLALDFLLDDRRFPSAISAGVGFMVKIIPALMLPVALRRLWHQYKEDNQTAGIEAGLYSVVFGLTILVLLAPFLFVGPDWVLASARSILGRSSWETVWAVIDGYYGFGAVLGDRYNAAETSFAIHGGAVPGLYWWTSLAFFGLYAFLFTREADYNRPRNVISFAGLTVAIFMLYSKGYSPQFLVYLLPFILLIFPDGRGLTYALVLTGLNILEQPIYFVLLPEATWLLTFIVVFRFLLVALLALEFALILWPEASVLAPVAQLRPRVPLVMGGVAGLAVLILIPVLLRTYRLDRIEENSMATFASFMETQATEADAESSAKPRLLVSDQATYRQIYPYLSGDFDLRLAGGATLYDGAPRVVDLIEGLDTVWILPTGTQEQTLSNTVSGRGQLLASYNFEGLGTASRYALQGNISPFIAPARFATGIELLDHRTKVHSGVVEVTLYWRALEPQGQSLTVFTQLLNEEGGLVASQDSIPTDGTNPTNKWPENAVQIDTHRISIPSNLAAGEYTLITGLYNNFTQRVRAIDPGGLSFTNEAIPLETLNLP